VIEDYFTQTFILSRKTRTRTSGVVKESLTEQFTFQGILDKETTSYKFNNLREEFEFSDILFCPILDIREDDVLTFDGKTYDVISVIDPLYRQHHLEVLINRNG